ncbi:ribosomal protein S18 [Zopfia rhizophila CBS 207.26]|uniref:Small ribosomal subunit protein bS18m n=1 Tax=Zopfia rhizophila CBS 207.26 TaxID=1314779 RepID=A0A6A6EVW8_9PEZI|nr:ribosomal protein S18 [Zopfia rhizophila CBS 207.26]
MSITQVSFRSSRSIGRQCLRSFSSSQRCQEDIIDILKSSPVTRSHPSNTQSQNSSKSSSAVEYAQKIGLSAPRQAEAADAFKRQDFERQVFRKWQPGDVYAPHDLSGPEQRKWKMGRQTPKSDAFDTLGINPVNEYKNFTMMSEYMTEMGRIKHSSQTGLRPVNQRKIAKAIRRAIGLGLMPSVHRHPLVLRGSKPSRFN